MQAAAADTETQHRRREPTHGVGVGVAVAVPTRSKHNRGPLLTCFEMDEFRRCSSAALFGERFPRASLLQKDLLSPLLDLSRLLYVVVDPLDDRAWPLEDFSRLLPKDNSVSARVMDWLGGAAASTAPVVTTSFSCRYETL